ncbi:hypothetical protein NQ317_012592 [Molorchus minor]|uniref:Tyr recombinase domain-containing protein n=1 Tax=Molorchus minor TaxID=1323400 RepID=A0ABQ9JBM1_9CUCU|nr:hypothetical protein NQ317_012592 [Molorchus minor]
MIKVGLILGIAGACRTDELVNLTVDDIEDPVGKNTMGKIPSVVASYLKLPDVACYTGHCLRRSSATLLADAGVDITTIKRHAGWKSTTVAEGYVENSIENKTKIANQVLRLMAVGNEYEPHRLFLKLLRNRLRVSNAPPRRAEDCSTKTTTRKMVSIRTMAIRKQSYGDTRHEMSLRKPPETLMWGFSSQV